MRSLFRKSFKFTLLLAMLTAVQVAHAEVVVIVSARSSVASLTDEQTAKIFLGKVTTFPNGQPAYPIDQPQGNAIRDEFYSKVTHKDSSQVAAYWAKIIFTGEGRPPKLIIGDKAVVKIIADNPSAIGYVDRSALNRTVRVVLEP